jgi:hypothetical protein
MSAFHGVLNWWTQHFILDGRDGVVAMGRGYRRGFTVVEQSELWDRWQGGESLKAIGRVFGKPSSSIYFQVAPHGGIRPARRRRSRLALTLVEREEISRGIAADESARSMARKLGRSPSSVAREISRNGGTDQYRASRADEAAWERSRRPKRCKLAHSARVRETVARKLRENWSPEQIAGWLKSAYPSDEAYQVSHETIYRSLFVQARGVLKKELLQHLRSKRIVLGFILVVGGVIGAQFGVGVGFRMRAEELRVALAALLVVIALRLAAELVLTPTHIYSVVTGQ